MPKARRKDITTIPGILGPITVAIVDVIRDSDGDRVPNAIGYYAGATRKVQLEAGQHAAQEHQTREHEWAHSVLIDTGVANLLSHDLTEAVCDAFGLGLAKRLHGAA